MKQPTMIVGKYCMSKNKVLSVDNHELTKKWPRNVKTLVTTRSGGYSSAVFTSLNLGDHVGDKIDDVIKNRALLRSELPNDPVWLKQTHSNYVLDLDNITKIRDYKTTELNFDAVFTRKTNQVCTVMTADCLPILLTDRQGSFVAAIHAGWRGVENGIIRNTILAIKHTSPENILAYIGPSICQSHFEVGPEVKESFIQLDSNNKQFFINGKIDNKFDCDVTGIATLQLINLGLKPENIYKSNICTYCNPKEFFSYRRENITGRIASCIWLSK